MRFRLLNIIWVFTIASLLLAWYADRAWRQQDISGVWYSTVQADGPRATLSINRDGTFSKKHITMWNAEIHSEVYSGRYAIGHNGVATFHVTTKECSGGQRRTKTDVDARYRCRAAIDSHGDLIVAELWPYEFAPYVVEETSEVQTDLPKTDEMDWQGCYTKLSHDEQFELVFDRLTEWLRDPTAR